MVETNSVQIGGYRLQAKGDRKAEPLLAADFADELILHPYDNLVLVKKLSAEQRRKQIQALAAVPDNEVDTSDIPELTEEQMARAIRGQFYRPVRRPVTMRLDADVIDWLKKDGPGYQTKANHLLRAEMLRSYRSAKPVQSAPKRRAK